MRTIQIWKAAFWDRRKDTKLAIPLPLLVATSQLKKEGRD